MWWRLGAGTAGAAPPRESAATSRFVLRGAKPLSGYRSGVGVKRRRRPVQRPHIRGGDSRAVACTRGKMFTHCRRVTADQRRDLPSGQRRSAASGPHNRCTQRCPVQRLGDAGHNIGVCPPPATRSSRRGGTGEKHGRDPPGRVKRLVAAPPRESAATSRVLGARPLSGYRSGVGVNRRRRPVQRPVVSDLRRRRVQETRCASGDDPRLGIARQAVGRCPRSAESAAVR